MLVGGRPAIMGKRRAGSTVASLCRRCAVAAARWCRRGVVAIEYDTWLRSLYANCVPPCGAALKGVLLGCGAMAQLVARLHGMQKVRGSNPLSSTAFFENSFEWIVTNIVTISGRVF